MINKKIFKEIDNLKKDNKSGANEFIKKALKVIQIQLNYVEGQNEDITPLILELSKEIISSRPSMAPLINTIGFLIHGLKQIDKNSLQLRVKQLKEKREKTVSTLSSNFQIFLKNLKKTSLRIMLISYSSTIINLLNKSDKNSLIIYILESRPLFEGREVAKILSNRFETHLIIDAALGKFIDQIDIILIGVDSILQDGSIINKIGTYSLAVLGKLNEIDVYAVCDIFKYNLLSHYGYEIKIEPKPIKEVYDTKIKGDHLNIHNYYFDITPPKYIDGVISELGVLPLKEFIEKAKDKLPIDWFKEFIQ